MSWVMVLLLTVALALGGGSPGWGQGAAEKVREASKKAAQDYVKSGLAEADMGNNEAAVKSFRQAVSLDPQWAEAHSLLGSALVRVGKYPEAEEQLRKAVQLKPDYAEGYYYLGLYLKERGKEQEAQEAFRKAKQFQR